MTWYVDGDQVAGQDLTAIEWQVRGGQPARAEGRQLVTRSAEDERWLTLTVTARDRHGRAYFGSRTVRVLPADEYLQRRVIRTLNAIAFPDEQGGALVGQHATEGELAERVIPVRLRWISEHTEELLRLLADLDARWSASGRMADASLRPDEK